MRLTALTHKYRQMLDRHLLAGLLCFILFLLFYGITARAELQVSDEVAVFATSASLVTKGTLAIDEMQWLQDTVNIGKKGRDGHLYTKYFPGNIFSAAAIYRLLERPLDQPYIWNHKVLAPSNSGARMALRLNAILGALGMVGLFCLIRHYFGGSVAAITVCLIGVCSDWWYQSRGFLSEVGAGALLTLGMYFAITKRPFRGALALAASLLFRPLNLIVLPAWVIAAKQGGRRVAWSVFPILGSLSLLALYNFARFGSPLDFGYVGEGFYTPLLRGLYGILLSPGRSPFVYSPILLLAIPGFVLLCRRERIFALACLFAITAYILAASSWSSWDGGWTWGSRLLTPVIPLAGFLVAPVVERGRSRRWLLVLIVVLAAIGLTVQLVALARDPLGVIITQVSSGEVTYHETVHTVHNSWLALQVRSLKDWHFCDLDGYALRSLWDCQ